MDGEPSEPPPPVLLSADPRPRVDAFCGVAPPRGATELPEGHVAGAYWPDKEAALVDHGAAMLDAGTEALPALLWTEDLRKHGRPSRLVLFVPNAPVAALEQALCDARAQASPYERRQYPDANEAEDRVERRKEVGAYVRALGPSAYSTAVLTDAYHVERTGEAAFWRVREPRTPGERRACALAHHQRSQRLGNASPRSPICCTSPLAEAAAADEAAAWAPVAIFEASGRDAATERAYELALQHEVASAAVAAVEEQLAAHTDLCETLGPLGPVGPVVPARRGACARARALELELRTAPRLPTLSRLLGQCAALARVRRLAGGGRAAVGGLFLPGDRLWCTRALGLGRDLPPPAPGRRPERHVAAIVEMVRAVAQRVAPPQAVLLLEVAAEDECLQRAALSCADFSMQVSVDAVVRLLACPWACPVVVRANEDELCTVDVSGVERDGLSLTEAVRAGFREAPAAPAATSGELAALRASMDARFGALERALAGAVSAAAEKRRREPADDCANCADAADPLLRRLRAAKQQLARLEEAQR